MMAEISQHEMDRRRLISLAHSKLIEAMAEVTNSTSGLTPLEWCHVLGDCQQRIAAHGLREEWME